MSFDYVFFADDLGMLSLSDLYKKYHSSIPVDADSEKVFGIVRQNSNELSLITGTGI
jgi:hypothetical protein